MKKIKIPKKVREQVWVQSFGEVYKSKCSTVWCSNTITVHDFHCGHKVAETNGGTLSLDNLIPICARCNLSMATKSFEEWNALTGTMPPPTATLEPKTVAPNQHCTLKKTKGSCCMQ